MAFRTDSGGGGIRKPKPPKDSLRPDMASNPSAFPLASATMNARAQKGGQMLRNSIPKTSASRSVAPDSGGSYAPYSGGGDFYGGGGGGGMAPMVEAPSEEDYLAGDAGYQTEFSALQAALQRFLADSDFQKTNYQTDYDRSLRDLGYDEGTKQWNWNDELTASGRGYQNQLDDFAARNMLQSQGYADANNELQRMLGQQYDSMSGARTSFLQDLTNQTANFKGENTANQQAARAEALQRRAAQYAL